MKLYHFASIRYACYPGLLIPRAQDLPDELCVSNGFQPGMVEVNERFDLQPQPLFDWNENFTKAVWLTTDRDSTRPADQDATGQASCCVRVSLKIPLGAPKLKQWHKWGARHGMADTDGVVMSFMDGIMNQLVKDRGETAAREIYRKQAAWWLYFGVVPFTRFNNIEILEGQIPWWLE
jgi:hypothetical protein